MKLENKRFLPVSCCLLCLSCWFEAVAAGVSGRNIKRAGEGIGNVYFEQLFA